MIKSYINILVMLFFSWSVYSNCQQDTVLPVAAAAIVLLSLVVRLKSSEKQFAIFDQVPLSAVIISSFVIGMFWRNIVPVPDDAISPYPEYAAALQSGSIFAAVFFWLRPFNKRNMFCLIFCAWLTVALSVNVPFTEDRLMVFSSFCFVSIAVVIFNTMKKPPSSVGARKHTFLYIRDYVVFSTLLIMLTTVLFLGISTTIVAMERAFLRTMSEYIMPRQYTNFLRIRSQLNLITPGTSAFDRRPVLEISLPDIEGSYLKLQIFENYNNGTWLEPVKIPKTFLPTTLLPDQAVGKIMMFAAFQDIVPAPGGITAVKAKTPYLISKDEIIYTEYQQRTRIMEFSVARDKQAVELPDDEWQRFTLVPPAIAPQLQEIAKTMIGDENDNKAKARKMVRYFHKNFQYSLDTDFSADDKGLVQMLTEKKPAYCTYFASALALLLRSEGIPARVAAGFFTTELVDRKENTYLARVNNAHAWTEVLLPGTDPVNGQTIMTWQTFDATPADFGGLLTRKQGIDLERVFEKMWLGILRINAKIQNMDKDQLKLYLISFLAAIMAFTNRNKIIAAIKEWVSGGRGAKRVTYKTPDALRSIYARYETHIKEKYGEVRGLAETDRDVVLRIRERSSADEGLDDLEDFVREFQSVRFGTKSSENLEELLKNKNFTKNSKKA